MISLYTGTPGSGKSMHLAQIINDVIKYKYKYIVSNFTVNPDYFKGKNKNKYDEKYYYFNNLELNPDNLYEISKQYFNKYNTKGNREGKLLLIIDEAQILFNARTWNAKGRDKWIEFFTLHRHLGYDVILTCQFENMIDKQIRSLVEYQYIHRKLTNFGIKGYFLYTITLGCKFSYVEYWYPVKQRITFKIFRTRKKYYNMYDTYTLEYK